MGRIINPESAGKERNRLTKAVVLAIRELSKQSTPDDTTRDLASFVSIALSTIADTIDPSVAAWEKRGYWVKADRYRMEWAWTSRLSEKIRVAVLGDDWSVVAQTIGQVAERLHDVQVSKRHRLGAPWIGAYRQMKVGKLPRS